MRACTATGINNSLLPRDCSCGGFPDGHLPVVLSGKRPLSGVCEEFVGSAVWGRDLFPGIFGIRHIRYRRGPPVVRNMHSVHENPLLWYARVVVCEYVIGYFRRTDNSLKLSATLSGDGIV